VARRAGIPRGEARRWIDQGRIRVRGRIIRVQSRGLPAGTPVEILPEEAEVEEAPAGGPPVEILHLDPWVVVVSKPSGLLSGPSRRGGICLQGILPEILAAAGERHRRVWLVHRLDYGTSGVLVLARRKTAAGRLGQAFAEGRTRKLYLALCAGRLEEAREVDRPIRKRPAAPPEIHPAGRPARTRLEPLAATDQASLILARPRTGRTHQIRLHLAHLGHPILGDAAHGGPLRLPGGTEECRRLLLHAMELTLPHPRTGEALRVEAPVPAEMLRAARRLGLADGLP